MRRVKPIPCAWQSIVLPVIRITDTFGRNWIERRYPGRDQVDLEDAGMAPSSFEVEAIFFGERWLLNAKDLRQQVEDGGEVAGTFTHPFWGKVDGVIRSVRFEHLEDRHDGVSVTFTFQEGTVGQLSFATTATTQSASAAASAAIASAAAAAAGLPT